MKEILTNQATIFDGFDLTQTISVISLICMAVALVAVIAVPVILIFYVKNRFAETGQSLLVGVLVYMLSNMLVFQLVMMGIQAVPMIKEFFEMNYAFQISVTILILAILEFLGIYFGQIFLNRKGTKGIGGALMFGLGITITYLLMVSITNMGGNLLTAMTINSTGLETLLTGGGSLSEVMSIRAVSTEVLAVYMVKSPLAMMNTIQEFVNLPWVWFLAQGWDVLMALVFRLSICVLVYGALTESLPRINLWIAMVLQILYSVPSFLMAVEVLNVYTGELCFTAVSVCAMLYMVKLVKRDMPEEWKQLMSKVKKAPKGKNNQGPHKMPKIVMPKD